VPVVRLGRAAFGAGLVAGCLLLSGGAPAIVPASGERPAPERPAAVEPAAVEPAAVRPTAVRPAATDRLVIGHRGASGYRPEHTLAAYELAVRMGADYIELDVVSTADGVLVARHENEISRTTDVAAHPEFAARRTTRTIDGVRVTGWFTEDFTLAELRTLRAVERLPTVREESARHDGRYPLATLEEVLALRHRLSREVGREIGVVVETKHPTYFDGIGLSLEEPLLVALRAAGLDGGQAPVFVESFETRNLRELDETAPDVPLLLLLRPGGAPYDCVATGDPCSYAGLSSRAGLTDVAEYADGVGPDKNQVIPRLPDGRLGAASTFVADAHAAGLLVHAYTFDDQNRFPPAALWESAPADDFGSALEEQMRFWAAGVDGLFTDHPDVGVTSRDLFEQAAAAGSG
jgi:glycerophosphoryl diester phosphodiesterase